MSQMYLSFRELYLQICRILDDPTPKKVAKTLQRRYGFATDLLLTALIFWPKTWRKWRILQKSKFCSVGAIGKIFERDF